jgi:hypothetical protein
MAQRIVMIWQYSLVQPNPKGLMPGKPGGDGRGTMDSIVCWKASDTTLGYIVTVITYYSFLLVIRSGRKDQSSLAGTSTHDCPPLEF